MDELDISWFKNQEIIEKKYDNFYKVNLPYINIKFLYVKNDELVYGKKLKYNLNNNTLTKNELINIFLNLYVHLLIRWSHGKKITNISFLTPVIAVIL